MSDEAPDSVEFTETGGWIERWDNARWRDDIDAHAPLKAIKIGFAVDDDRGTANVSLTLEWIFAGSRHESPTLYGDRHAMRALAEGILEAIDDGLPDELGHLELK